MQASSNAATGYRQLEASDALSPAAGRDGRSACRSGSIPVPDVLGSTPSSSSATALLRMSSPICRLLAAVAVLLSGCTTLQPSMPYPGAGEVPGSACVALQPGLPAQLPKDAVPFPQQAPYLLIPADSAVGLLVPLPFVSGSHVLCVD
eukprot:Opistho-1_new@93612